MPHSRRRRFVQQPVGALLATAPPVRGEVAGRNRSCSFGGWRCPREYFAWGGRSFHSTNPGGGLWGLLRGLPLRVEFPRPPAWFGIIRGGRVQSLKQP